MALRYVGGNVTLLEELLRIFLEDAPRRLAALREAVLSGDVERMETAAHSLKGTLRALGAVPSQALATALEAMAREKRLDGAEPVLETLEREMVRLAAFFADPQWKEGA